MIKGKSIAMKKIRQIFILTLTIVIFTVQQGTAQTTGPQDPGGSPEAGPPLGGGAPVGNGVYVLLFLGAAYGAVKHFRQVNGSCPEKD